MIKENMSFMVEDDIVLVEYNEIWNKIKEIERIKFHSSLVYDDKYIKAKVKEFNGVVNRNFCGDKVPKEDEHYTCIVCLSIESIMKMDKKNYSQVYLEDCKYKLKKKNMVRFTDYKLGSDSGSDSE